MDSELRHMTSAGHLASQRSSNRNNRLGSRSPNSIPSSPTSVHSSSSAIFERDIEPIAPPSPPFLGQNPHRIPRAKGTEQLEHAVPSVLDSAASILAGIDESPESSVLDHISVVAPAPPAAFDSILARSPGSGFASPIGSFRSRSPSPLGLRVATGAPGVVQSSIPILNIPPPMSTSPSHSAVSSSSPPLAQGTHTVPSSTPRSTLPSNAGVPPNSVITHPPPPAIVTPPLNRIESSESSPMTETARGHAATATTATTAPQSQSGTTTTIPASGAQHTSMTSSNSHTSPTTSPLPLNLSHPPSPTHGPTKRLSFMSYSDLLTSTPASTLPLSSLTTSASTIDPPPHIPALSGVTGGTSPSLLSPSSPSGGTRKTSSTATSLRGFALPHAHNRDSIVMMDDVGGEWEREGLGRGLEERLEALSAIPPPHQHQHPQQVVMKT
ncbi:hypothetical protein D9756_009693 [Leucocoprinus leucothites]|uniref:Uncharacterized protein n=1 Tax=Leucocoprinus leucothites TaxID=201217 RepID=A0A8H5FT02_9AGAR|nr:hypothetical protein D9756_009693 [Leucoagaricus leucothites]